MARGQQRIYCNCNRTSRHFCRSIPATSQVRCRRGSPYSRSDIPDSQRVVAQLELDFNSVERIVDYLDVPQEAPSIIEKNRPPAYWPSSNGELVVQDLVVRYASDLPPILRKLSFTIRPAEKVGVVSRSCSCILHRSLTFIFQVGRTGSGKQTTQFNACLLPDCLGQASRLWHSRYSEWSSRAEVKLCEYSKTEQDSSAHLISCFRIDGIDISTVGLEDLRSRVVSMSHFLHHEA